MPHLLLFCDTDCLIQIFITNQTSLLKWLKAKYGIKSVIVPEVESELAWNVKFKDRFDKHLKKALSAGVISAFDYSRPDLHLSEILPLPQATITARAISETGLGYNLRVGRGEAYSHAACIHLGTPLLSHDRSAIITLLQHGLQTAVPVLRVFDLIGLAYRQGGMTMKACDSARQALSQSSEFLPRAFKHATFEHGLRSFEARLYDLTECTGTSQSCQKFDDPLFLSRSS